MNILCSTDDNFAQHCAVLLISILKNNPDNVSIYLFTEGLSDYNEKALKEIVKENGGDINIVLVDPELLTDCPMPSDPHLSHISKATYYRLWVSKLLPNSIDKIIYLDCDIVVRHSLLELWETPLDNFALGAVYQIGNSSINDIKRLGYPVKYGYFNAGVLLLNLKYWRDNQIPEKLFEFLSKNKEVIHFHDQDVLNGVLFDKCIELPCKWNMLNIFFLKRTLLINDVDAEIIVNDYSKYKEQMLIYINDPIVIHFASKPKPWNLGSTHPYRSEYNYYLQFTPWYEYVLPKIWSFMLEDYRSIYPLLRSKIHLIISNPYLKIKHKF